MHLAIDLDRQLDEETYNLVGGLARTRRMKRDVAILSAMVPGKDVGNDGEFYYNPLDFRNSGQSIDPSIVDYNTPPSCQPDLWLHWTPTKDRKQMIWTYSEQTVNILEWLVYLIQKVFGPRGYCLSGDVQVSESIRIRIENNEVLVNDRAINVMEMLMNIMMSNMRVNLNTTIVPGRILKMEMSPGQKWAIEIEDTSSEVMTVLSSVENEITLVQQFSDVLFSYSGHLELDSEAIEIHWSDDAMRSAVVLGGILVTVYDLANQRMIKSSLNGSDLVPVPSKYFDEGIIGNIGQIINI
ncbi:hypothetical protein [Paenibacillus riograndensis]|uniref:hypothetical protein n=1 Tax=Paenibacillus riograndensis TaxID=483937 RepID=UPI000764B24D|nr:hypothetical protein [Paenibacillus riograndensis]